MASPFIKDIGMLTIHSDDINRSIAFYRDTLGMECTGAWPEAGFAEFQVGANKFGVHVWDKGCQSNGGRPPATATSRAPCTCRAIASE